MKLLHYIFVFLIFMPPPSYGADVWSENVFSYVKNKYGDDAEKRMRYLNKIIIDNQNKTDLEKLEIANNTINLFPWIADKSKWNQTDYWATPIETIATFGGDCEDMVFAKWLLLRHLGIKKHHLYYAYVKLGNTDKAHMVLLYNSTPNLALDKSKVYVLDNMDREVKLVGDRPDLEGVYVIDPDNKILIITKDKTQLNEKHKNKHNIEQVLSAKHFKKFSELKAHFMKDREQFKELNDGQYLLPDL